MKFSVSIVPKKNYDFLETFSEVAETLHYGLLELGHDSILCNHLEAGGRQHIVLGANLLPFHDQMPPPDAVLYNLEQAGSYWMSNELLDIYRGFRLWDYSKTNVEMFAGLGIKNVQLLPIGYVPQLTRIESKTQDIDVLIYGCFNERRRAIVDQLRNLGLRVETLYKVWRRERDEFIARSRIVLNVHLYDAGILEQVRISYLLANHCFVVSEHGTRLEEDQEFSAGLVFSDYRRLAETCVEYLSRPADRERISASGYRLMTHRREADFLRAVLPSLGGAKES